VGSAGVSPLGPTPIAGSGGGGGGFQNFADDPVHNLLPLPPLPPRRLLRENRENRRTTKRPPNALSASWSSGQRIMNGLIHGPHFIPHLFDDDHLLDDHHFQEHDRHRASDDNRHFDTRQRNESIGGSTWPPTGEGRAWWDSVKRVGVLSVLELERQIGLSPASLVFGGSFTPYETGGDDDFSDDDGMMSDDEVTQIRRRDNVMPEGSMELQELRDRIIPNVGGTTTRVSSSVSIMSRTSSSNSVRESELQTTVQSTTTTISTSTSTAPPVPAQQMSASDEFLFQNIFNAHPFAGAAFLRAFIACSFGLVLFHLHSVLSWPDHPGAFLLIFDAMSMCVYVFF
jgi:hypothetical protein